MNIKLSHLLIVLVALMATVMTGCAPWAVNTTNTPEGTSYSSNRNLPKDYIPRSFTADLEAGPDGVNMLWVGNPDSIAKNRFDNAKAWQDSFWKTDLERRRIENRLLAGETLPGATLSSASVYLDNQSGYWVWIKDGDNGGFSVCLSQGTTIRLTPGSKPHFSIYILRSRPLNSKHTPAADQIVGSYTEDNWVVPSIDNWVAIGENTKVNGVYTITWPHVDGHYGSTGFGAGGGTYWTWNECLLQYDQQHGY